MVHPPKNLRSFESLLQIVEALRGPQGCPWDKEQTHRSLAPYAIEEAHEFAESVENSEVNEMVSELGDLLLQVVLHAEIGRQSGQFTLADVIEAISSKMVRRHPHVFSEVSVSSSQDVLANWSQIKAEEKKNKQAASTSLSQKENRFDVSLSLPALVRSQKIGDKTKQLRFDWNNAKEVLAKVDEELSELKAEVSASPVEREKLEHELGDLLFSTAQLARHLGLDAEQCLRTTNSRFELRYFTMTEMIEKSGRTYEDLSANELEVAWQNAKALLDSDKGQ